MFESQQQSPRSRFLHLAGSLPEFPREFPYITQEASLAELRWALEYAAYTRSMPDGQPEDRLWGLAGLRNRLQDFHPETFSLKVASDESFEYRTRLDVDTVGLQHSTISDALGYGKKAEYYSPEVVAYNELHRRHLLYQCAVPSPLTAMTCLFGAIAWPRYRQLKTLLQQEIIAMTDATEGGLLVQIDASCELYVAQRAKRFGAVAGQNFAVAHQLAQFINDIVREDGSRPAYQCGVHLCLGFFNGQPLARYDSIASAVRMARPLMKRCSNLDYIYLSCDTANEEWHRPEAFKALRHLRDISTNTRVVLGVVDERLGWKVQQQMVQWAEDALGSSVDLAAPCGLGGKTVAAATENVERTLKLLDLPVG